jgi:DNA-binding NarL/FixJ family response regulator
VTIRVLLADDQELVRTGFRMIIDAREDLAVVGEAADGREAVAVAERTAPDVVLMDVRMPNLDGIAATRALVDAGHPARIIMLTTFDLDEPVFAALRAGASGFMLKDVRAPELVDGIRVVARGEARCSPPPSHAASSTASSTPSPAPRVPRPGSTSSPSASSRCCAWWPRPSRTARSRRG